MIEINLLPDRPKGVKSKRVMDLPLSLPVMPVFAGFLVLLILADFVIGAAVMSKRVALSRYEQMWSHMADIRSLVEPVRDDISKIRSRNKLIADLTDNRILWSEKLNRISASLWY